MTSLKKEVTSQKNEVPSQKKEETNLSRERKKPTNCSTDTTYTSQKEEYKALVPACMNGCLDLYPRHQKV